MVTEQTPTVEEAMAALQRWAIELEVVTRQLQAAIDKSREEDDKDGPPARG